MNKYIGGDEHIDIEEGDAALVIKENGDLGMYIPGILQGKNNTLSESVRRLAAISFMLGNNNTELNALIKKEIDIEDAEKNGIH